MGSDISRRELLGRGVAVGLAAGIASQLGPWSSVAAAAPHARLRRPGSRPDPHKAPGTDLLPKVEHIIVVMMENHSYDNYFGMLRRGDGFTLDRRGQPTDSNPDPEGGRLRVYRAPSTCQPEGGVSQSWNSSHLQYADGRNDGFLTGGHEFSMAYLTAEELPFYDSLASTFPVCDRWFGSVLAQTYPNRRFLMAGTAYGLVSTDVKQILAPSPANGTIFDQLNAHGISWRNYYSDLPQAGLFASVVNGSRDKLVNISQYYADAAAGTLPSVSYVDPLFEVESEENPQNEQAGEAFASKVVNAAMQGPGWEKTVLIWLYDEHGGYYDHVPPPRAVKPDDIEPDIQVPPDQPGSYDRYGFRVPAVVVSPYARKRYVSHVVHDHTSVLKLIESKWNLPALTFRDANADDLLDCLDFRRRPAFLEPPKLAEPGLQAKPSACTPGNPGPFPPADAKVGS